MNGTGFLAAVVLVGCLLWALNDAHTPHPGAGASPHPGATPRCQYRGCDRPLTASQPVYCSSRCRWLDEEKR